ncbi:hypothetical protein F5Y08DRAFT_313440 [Xylaria arbuscula]|nr:hypothetical protein F5Y08DRAFT_313440 [Xylaria arbuscula]
MRHITGLITPARALHRVLILELANTTPKSNSNSNSNALFSRSPTLSLRTSHSTHIQCTRPRRLFSTTQAAHKAPQTGKGFLRNEDIPYRWVRVADASGVLSAAQPIRNVIAALPEGHTLIMVAPPPEKSPPSSDQGTTTITPPAAICRIENTLLKSQQAREAREREKQERAAAPQTKTLELNWAIAAHDLSHKMKRLAEFLSKGLRVEIIFARKRGSRVATAEEQEGVLQTIKDTALGVPGANEFRKPDGRVGGVLKMFLEGPAVVKKAKKKEKQQKDRGKAEGKGDFDVEI